MDIKEKIKNWIKETLEIAEEVILVHPTNLEHGDFSWILPPLNIRPARNALHCKAGGGGEGVLEKLNRNKLSEIDKIEFVSSRFINFYLSNDFFADSVKEINKKGEEYGRNVLLKEKKFFIEHTQPNPFKEFHIGHLMNNAIGESIVRIVKANGGDVKTATYHGDVGLHVAKAVWAKQNKPELNWGEAYAHGSTHYDENKDEVIGINKKIYDQIKGDIYNIYIEGREASLNSFESMYKKLDSQFDFHFYESEAGEMGKKIVLENVGKVFEESDRAVIFRGENFEPKTHTRVFLNSDGLPTYEAKEVGLAQIKKEIWPYDCSITITANEQDAFFDVVEVAIGKVFPNLKGKLKHLSHGMLKLLTGKMSSRTGEVITAEALISQVKEKVLEKIKDRNFDNTEKENVAEVVAIGAIKYSILRQAIGGNIVFDFNKSISFEGDSGPYLQYTYTRAHSVLAKSEALNSKFETKRPENFKITEIEKYLYRFLGIVEKAGREFAPHLIVTYLIELASLFNSFYAKEKIIDENDPASSYKIALTSAVVHTLQNGLRLLGIKTLEKM